MTAANIEAPLIPAISRKFWAIMGLSVLLHATLFAVTSWQRKHGPVSLPPILASIRLIDVSASEPVAAAAESPAPATVPQKARQTPTRMEQQSAPHVTQTAGPANVPAPAASPSVPALAESVAPAATPSAPAEVVRPAPAVAAQRPQSEVLEGYRQRLGELFARHQEYPRVAAMRGWEGEVRLRLKVARKGNLLGVVLDHSSGFDVLDQHALAMLEAMTNLPPLPDALEANEISVVVPINYRLKKTT
jgi:periplasmic protein TonB